MPVACPQTTHGTTVTLSDSTGFLAKLTNVNWSGISREAIEAYHYDVSGYEPFLPSDTADPGQIDCEMQWNSGETPPATGAAETVTLTSPDGSTWAATGFLIDFEIVGATKTTFKANSSWKFSGDITITPAE